MATSRPNLRVLIDGHNSRAYHEGDPVKGRVSLVLEQQEKVKSLKLRFFGECTSRTTRAIYVSGVDAHGSGKARAPYEERVELFNLEQNVLPNCNLPASKYSWNFEFTFPSQTERQFSRWAHGSKYAREPHPLPPTFQAYTDTPGGQATVTYRVEAQLVLGGAKETVKASEMLGYMPSAKNTPLEPQIRSRVLYAQTWKPTPKDPKKTVEKIFKKSRSKQTQGNSSDSNNSTPNPRIVPTVYYPEKIAPGQHIPLLLCLACANVGNDRPECILDSLTVTLTTHTTSMCGQLRTQPEDIVTKHVPCISRQNINQPLSFSTTTPLTTNFRLIDDAECVPTFKTYTITRRYTITLTIGVKCAGKTFAIKSTTPLDILPRVPLSELQLLRGSYARQEQSEEEEIEPLPLYAPREPSEEFAPNYEELYATLGGGGGASPSSSRSASLVSGVSTPSTAPTTPGMEIGEPVFRREGC
jgi:hypothetical protein